MKVFELYYKILLSRLTMLSKEVRLDVMGSTQSLLNTWIHFSKVLVAYTFVSNWVSCVAAPKHLLLRSTFGSNLGPHHAIMKFEITQNLKSKVDTIPSVFHNTKVFIKITIIIIIITFITWRLQVSKIVYFYWYLEQQQNKSKKRMNLEMKILKSTPFHSIVNSRKINFENVCFTAFIDKKAYDNVTIGNVFSFRSIFFRPVFFPFSIQYYCSRWLMG